MVHLSEQWEPMFAEFGQLVVLLGMSAVFAELQSLVVELGMLAVFAELEQLVSLVLRSERLVMLNLLLVPWVMWGMLATLLLLLLEM